MNVPSSEFLAFDTAGTDKENNHIGAKTDISAHLLQITFLSLLSN